MLGGHKLVGAVTGFWCLTSDNLVRWDKDGNFRESFSYVLTCFSYSPICVPYLFVTFPTFSTLVSPPLTAPPNWHRFCHQMLWRVNRLELSIMGPPGHSPRFLLCFETQNQQTTPQKQQLYNEWKNTYDRLILTPDGQQFGIFVLLPAVRLGQSLARKSPDAPPDLPIHLSTFYSDQKQPSQHMEGLQPFCLRTFHPTCGLRGMSLCESQPGPGLL